MVRPGVERTVAAVLVDAEARTRIQLCTDALRDHPDERHVLPHRVQSVVRVRGDHAPRRTKRCPARNDRGIVALPLKVSHTTSGDCRDLSYSSAPRLAVSD